MRNDEAATVTWAALCAGFEEIWLRARTHGLDAERHELVSATRDGTRPLAGWRALAAELDHRDGDLTERLVRAGADDGPAGGPAGDRWWERWDAPADLYGCPGGLCDRRREYGRAAPHCPLLDRDMAPLA